MNRPWSDIDPEEEKLLAQWNRDAAPPPSGCMAPEMIRAALEECLPEPELSHAKQHIAQCPMCAALSKDLSVLDMGGPTGLEARRMRARIGLPVEALATPPRVWWHSLAPWVLAAGCAALAVGVWTRIVHRQQPDNVPATVAKARPPRIMVRRAAVRVPLASLVWRGGDNKYSDPYPADLARALEPYGAANYVSAIPALLDVVAKHPTRAEGHFYLGVALVMVGRESEATAPLQAAKAVGSSSIFSEVDWYLAAALQNAGHTGEAHPLLQSVCSTEGIHQKEACAALGQK